jgi:hypothetical protein
MRSACAPSLPQVAGVAGGGGRGGRRTWPRAGEGEGGGGGWLQPATARVPGWDKRTCRAHPAPIEQHLRVSSPAPPSASSSFAAI